MEDKKDMAEPVIYNDEKLEFFDELILNSGDIANRTRIMSGGSLIVNAGATANSTIIESDDADREIKELIVSGTANSVVNRGGTVEVMDGGEAYFVSVSGNGIVAVRDGGEATGVIVGGLGTLQIFAGASVNSVTVENSGTLMLESGASVSSPVLNEGALFGYDFNCSLMQMQEGSPVNILKANESENYIIRNGSTQVVEDGFLSKHAEIQINGTQHVLSGGIATDTLVQSGGTLIVETGGTALGVTVENEKQISYDFGTTVTAKTKKYGEIIESTAESSYNYKIRTQQEVLNGYIAFGGYVLENAVQNVYSGGEASYMTVEEGGVQNVLEGGRANVSTVRGEMTVASGGISNYAEVKGGVMTVRAGGIANNTSVFLFGTLKLEAGAELNGITSVTGQIQAEGAVAVTGILMFNLIDTDIFGSGISPESLTVPLLNDITFFEGASFYLAVSPDQAKLGEYRLAANAADFKGNISVVSTNYMEIYSELDLTVNSSFARDGKQYTLALNDADELVLRVDAVPAGTDAEAPLKLRGVSANVYTGRAVTISWDAGVDNVGVTGYEVRYAAEGSGMEHAVMLSVSNCWGFLSDLAPGAYNYQVRALDAAGNKGEWSDMQSFRISDTAVPEIAVISTELWGHDYLKELYAAPAPEWGNDVSGYYFADAEKLNTPQDMLYCWGAAASNILTWTGWAENSPYAFRNEDEVFEYFISFWKNEGGMEDDAFTWFFNGTGNSGTMTVPVEGGNLFPQLNAGDYMVSVSVNTETSTLLNTLADYFDAGYGVSYAIYSDQGLAHAITGWGYEVDENGEIWLYYSDSDSDYWSESWDRRDAVNRLSKTRAEIKSDGRLYFVDYMVSGAYLGSFSAVRQFDKIFLGQHETFDDARLLEFDGSYAVRAGNLDGAGDEDYYMFSTEISSDLQITVSMATLDPALAGITVSLYDAGKRLVYSGSGYKTEQSFTFNSCAGEIYYLLVQGDACGSSSATVPTIDTYYVEISADPDADARKQAGISAADDTWRKVMEGEGLSYTVSGDDARLEPMALFDVEINDAEGNPLAETSNWIGPEDKKDLRAVQFETAGRYDFTLSAISSNAKLSVYQLIDDQLKLVKRISATAKTKEEKRGVFDLLLDAGTVYFVELESTAKTGTFYDVALSGEVFVKADNMDDSESMVRGNPDYTVSPAKSTEAAGTVSLSLFEDNWVGYSDRMDFRVLELADAGNYTFSLSQLDAKASGTLTVWKVQESGKNKKVFSLSGSSSKIREKTNLLLEEGTYIVSFESKSWKTGRNTGYTVALSGTAYGKVNRTDDKWQNAVELEGSSIADEWVGYSDLQDWRRFTVEADGTCSLELTGVTDNYASITLYKRSFKGTEEKNPSKIASSKAKGGTAEIEKFLTAGIYYFSVQAEGKAKKSGTSYNVELKFNGPEKQGMLA